MPNKVLETKNLNAFYGDFQALFEISIDLFEGEIISIIGANRSGAFLHLMPIFGAIMALVIFNEKFMYYHFLGVICIIAGITLSNKKLNFTRYPDGKSKKLRDQISNLLILMKR